MIRKSVHVHSGLTFIPLIHCAPNRLGCLDNGWLKFVKGDGVPREVGRKGEAVGRTAVDNRRKIRFVEVIVREMNG
jgi:hypothetical protein